MSISNKETWVQFALQALRYAKVYSPRDWFTASGFVEALGQHVAPQDPRWSGAVFQRAKREGLIRQVNLLGKPLTSGTPAGHCTPVWTFTPTHPLARP